MNAKRRRKEGGRKNLVSNTFESRNVAKGRDKRVEGGRNSAISLQEIRISTCARSNSDRIPPLGSKGTNADRRSINRRDKRVIQRGARGWNVYTESNDRHRATRSHDARPQIDFTDYRPIGPAAIFQRHIRLRIREPESFRFPLIPLRRIFQPDFFFFFLSLRILNASCFHVFSFEIQTSDALLTCTNERSDTLRYVQFSRSSHSIN